MISGHVVAPENEIIGNQEIVLLDYEFAELLRNVGIGIVQDEGTDAVAEKCHGRAHAVAADECENAALMVPPGRMYLRAQYNFLCYRCLPLRLVQCKHRRGREILVQIHGIEQHLKAGYRTQLPFVQVDIDAQTVHHEKTLVCTSVIVIYRIEPASGQCFPALCRIRGISLPEPIRIAALIRIRCV